MKEDTGYKLGLVILFIVVSLGLVLLYISIMGSLEHIEDQDQNNEQDPVISYTYSWTQDELTGPWALKSYADRFYYVPSEYHEVSVSRTSDIKVSTLYPINETLSWVRYLNPDYLEATYYFRDGNHNFKVHIGNSLIKTFNVTIDDSCGLHFSSDHGVQVKGSGYELYLYEVQIKNGTITDKWTVVISGSTQYRMEVNNYTVVKTNEWDWHNNKIGVIWEYPPSDIAYIVEGDE